MFPTPTTCVILEVITLQIIWNIYLLLCPGLTPINTGTTFTMPVAQMLELLGTSNSTPYALEQDSAVAAGAPKYTKHYTRTPYPGFWVSKNVQNIGWTSTTESPWGISFSIRATMASLDVYNIRTAAILKMYTLDSSSLSMRKIIKCSL
mgnify:CR=1 FL=1